MAIAKLILNGVTQMDLTSDTVSASTALTGTTGHSADGEAFQGTYTGGDATLYEEIIARTISSCVTSEISVIGSYAFYGCNVLSVVSLPAVSSIGYAAFSQCSSLETVNFASATFVASYAFYSCSKLTSVLFPLAASIWSYAFLSCNKLSEVYFPSVSYIGLAAFSWCTALTTISFPKARTVGVSAFCNTKIDNVYLPSVSNISSCGFAQATYMETISLPVLSSIQSSAFSGCYSLKACYFGESLLYNGKIYPYAFYYCRNLLSLYLLASSKIYTLSAINAFNTTPISTYTISTGGVYGSIYVRESLYSEYIAATNWATYSSRFVSLTDAQISNVLQYGTHNPT